MKNAIYVGVLVLLVFLSLILLFFYYTQPFTEELKFKDLITNENLNFTLSNDNSYIIDAKAEIGELTLKNNGYFTQVYSFPQIVGCINFKDDTTSFPSEIRIYLSYIYDNNYEVPRDSLEIPVGETRTFKILGRYDPGYYQRLTFKQLEDSVVSIELYKISKKEPNPFDEYGYYDYNYYGNDCGSLALKDEPLDTIYYVSALN